MASAMTWPASVPATTTVGDLTATMLAYVKRASVIKRQANAHVTLASGVLSATTIATAAWTPSAMQWQDDAYAILVGPGGTAQYSVAVTTRHATSLQDAASVGKECGVHVVNDTASVSMASATRRMARVPVHQGTVGSSAGSHVLLDSMGKTAGTGGVKKKNMAESKIFKNTTCRINVHLLNGAKKNGDMGVCMHYLIIISQHVKAILVKHFTFLQSHNTSQKEKSKNFFHFWNSFLFWKSSDKVLTFLC